ncbi:hypothetical protein ACHHYP_05617 [Achlya hypogyna]|uniref:LTD domain-containing protein n=1 Tax=Achlya hypogyna TaxID=1202772 RepID=A0A1V9YX54_ACHHY|nr:hypothetical protein ACHHYP_05617 [Achlya hypogyna]
MTSGKLRRVVLPSLDRRVARATMQINSPTPMQDVYLSRADVDAQWVVVSNPSGQDVDLSGYTLTDEAGTRVFRFPRGYVILAGEETTLWCAPGAPTFHSKNLVARYLLWTHEDGSLSSAPFYDPNDSLHEAILLDPYLNEVASLQISSTGHKTFRVLGSQSLLFALARPRTASYVFARYRNVTSDASTITNFVAILFTPLIELGRLFLLFLLLLQVLWTPATSNPRLLVFGFACDVAARIGCLCIRNAALASLMAQMSVAVDQFHVVCVYLALEQAYPTSAAIFRSLLTTELAVNLVGIAGAGAHRVTKHSRWHPMHTAIEAQIYHHPLVAAGCYLGKEALLFLLLLKASLMAPSLLLDFIMYLCVPLFCVSTAITVARGTTVALHVVDLSLARLRSRCEY